MKTTVTSKGQVTIPVRIRAKFNIAPGTILDFDGTAEQLVATVVSAQVPIRELIGSGRERHPGKASLQWLDEHRGAVTLPPAAKKRH